MTISCGNTRSVHARARPPARARCDVMTMRQRLCDVTQRQRSARTNEEPRRCHWPKRTRAAPRRASSAETMELCNGWAQSKNPDRPGFQPRKGSGRMGFRRRADDRRASVVSKTLSEEAHDAAAFEQTLTKA